MSVLSNILRRDDRDADAGAARYDCHPAAGGDVAAAVRMILGGPRRAAGSGDAADFMRFAADRGLDLSAVWVATAPPFGEPLVDEPADRRLVWALLPVASPGRTMLLSAPGRLPPPGDRAAVVALADAVCDHHRGTVELAQLLLDPDSAGVIDAHAAAGFGRLAELIYLRRDVPAGPGLPSADLPPQASASVYATRLRERFGAAILASYEQSLDCPALNGRRDAADILDGHAAAGEFAPDLWTLLTVDGRDAGVVLLNRMTGGAKTADGLELVYLGLLPWARGGGWADALLRRAVRQAATEPGRRLTLAVDAANTPALRLYLRHGFHELYRRVALLRDLRDGA